MLNKSERNHSELNRSELNKTVLYTLALLLAVVALLLSGGMGRGHWLSGVPPTERATLTVLGGAPYEHIERGAAMRFELFECASNTSVQRVSIPLWADSAGRFRTFSEFAIHPEAPHRFGDITWQVDPGCYRVRAQVIDQAGTPLGTCEHADSPNSFLEAAQSQKYVFLLDCSPPLSHSAAAGARRTGVRLQGVLNRAPQIAPLQVTRPPGETTCSTRQICAAAQDPDGDPLRMDWVLRTDTGRRVPAPPAVATHQHLAPESSRTECITLPADTRVRDVDVTVRDLSGAVRSPSIQTPPGGEALLSFEDLYLGDFGLIATSSARTSLRLEASCDPSRCPDNPVDRIRNIHYWISRAGALLPPTSDLGQVREGDTVDVEFDVAPGCEATRVEFSAFQRRAAHEASAGEAPTTKAAPRSSASKNYAPGTHLLWNSLPNCQFYIEFRVAQVRDSDAPTPQRGLDDPSSQRFQLVDSFSGGEHPCPQR